MDFVFDYEIDEVSQIHFSPYFAFCFVHLLINYLNKLLPTFFFQDRSFFRLNYKVKIIELINENEKKNY